jgi:hypothetical protein
MANWQEVKNKVVTFRNYVKSLTPNAKESAKYAFMVTKEEIKAMIDQAGGAQELDGIRAYFGADMIEGQMVPCIYFVGVKKDESGNYNDYDLGTTIPAGPQPLLAGGRPCPTMCSTANFLNS